MKWRDVAVGDVYRWGNARLRRTHAELVSASDGRLMVEVEYVRAVPPRTIGGMEFAGVQAGDKGLVDADEDVEGAKVAESYTDEECKARLATACEGWLPRDWLTIRRLLSERDSAREATVRECAEVAAGCVSGYGAAHAILALLTAPSAPACEVDTFGLTPADPPFVTPVSAEPKCKVCGDVRERPQHVGYPARDGHRFEPEEPEPKCRVCGYLEDGHGHFAPEDDHG